jgi:hypothetical protein
LECKKREVDTAELRAALDLLKPHIQPAWLIPQFRHNLDGEQEHDFSMREKVSNKYFAPLSPVFATVFENFSGYERMHWRGNFMRLMTWP